MRVQTRYAKSGNLHIAYQVFGQGAIDLVWCPGFVSNIELYWEDPRMAHYLERLASFARVITFDKRGTGLSDRELDSPTLEDRMDDIRAVMDATDKKGGALRLFRGRFDGRPFRCNLSRALSLPHLIRANGSVGDLVSDR